MAELSSPGGIAITLPDGAVRRFDRPMSGADIAADISKSLAKAAIGLTIDGKLSDLATVVDRDVKVGIVTRSSPEALELIRHDAAHVMAEAVQELYPGTQVTIGPAIENGFYYDFARDEPFTPDDLEKIEAKMRQIIARDSPFTCEVMERDKAKALFKSKGEDFKLELIDAIPEGE